MKKYCLLAFLLIPFCISAQFKTASMAIDGLTCSMCSLGVERAIGKLKFIEKVSVDLNTNTASIVFKQDEPVSIKSLAKSVFDAGFSVRNLTATFNFKQQTKQENFFQYENSVLFFLNPTERNLNGTIPLTFVEKRFTESTSYKKYKKVIDEKLSNTVINDSYYFVLL
jgi:copper chaperone CopZ